jgi:hypothetical protein
VLEDIGLVDVGRSLNGKVAIVGGRGHRVVLIVMRRGGLAGGDHSRGGIRGIVIVVKMQLPFTVCESPGVVMR